MEDFSALKCIAIAELFYVIISYHIYTSIYDFGLMESGQNS